MNTAALQKKRKYIDLPVNTFQKLSAMAASQGQSLKAFIENVLETKAEYSDNPSPSGDTWFDNPENIASVMRRIEDAKQGRTITMKSDETLDHFLDRIEQCIYIV